MTVTGNGLGDVEVEVRIKGAFLKDTFICKDIILKSSLQAGLIINSEYFYQARNWK